jgi:hypothetical protein
MANKVFVFLLAFALTISVALAGSYTIDGDLSDWGINDTDIKIGLCELNNATNTCGGNETIARMAWRPISGTIDYIVENNRDPSKLGFIVDPFSGFNATGVHILNGADYQEPSVYKWNYDLLEPVFGERFDLEALYFDNDENNAYFAIVTSMPPGITNESPPNTGEFWLGDLDILVNTQEGPKHYGIILNNHTIYGNERLVMGNICEEPKWINATIISENSPAFVDNCSSYTGNATIIYKKINISKEGYSKGSYSSDPIYAGLQDTYVIEIKVPLSNIGNPDPRQGNIVIHSTISCGNDVIDVSQEDNFNFNFNVPEMGAIAAGTVLTIGAVAFFRVRKKNLGGN